ncbi:molybdenum cofactor guanylyltransferase [Candidimonas humi]|jgi:molybdopterin-guanine dinucleotide biosynthesis protein A|uniref:Molybdenum cofactor guanylyltransferase n=1 Tax=Candidimonas humi TaxID=683355 RepID=A0ABV8P4H1_9BURK|nr:molybdenum cofactor guanylyltransferase MobA [Candidimonas humi]MBV6306218.1 molybdenum cofactor guanylyltransferase [Candidimonas humi]
MKSGAATSGLVLAGGQASRMRAPGAEPVDKGLLELGGMPLVEHACRYLRPRVEAVWISANRHASDYARYGAVLADGPEFGAQPGPLAGVAGALERIDTPWLLVLPVDVPLLPPDLASGLAQAVADAPAARLAHASCGGPQPLCMLLHRDLLDSLRGFLRGGGRKVQQWQARQGSVVVDFPEREGLFLNINTPEDLCRAERLLVNRCA